MRSALAFALAGSFALGACGNSNKPAPATAKPQSQDVAMRATCCAQCAGASSRDPSGMDISGKTCTSYPAEWNSGPGVDDACKGWFVAQPQPITVGDCRKSPPP